MRRSLLGVCILVACSFESFQGADEGSSSTASTEGSSGPSGSATSAGSEGQTSGGSTSTTPTTTTDPATSGPTPTTTGPDDPTTAGPETSDTETTGVEGALDDDGLVARYYLDEDDMGTMPEFARDAALEPLDLPLEYDGTMHYADSFGRRGLAFDQAGADDAARNPVENTKIMGIEGVSLLTYELVLDLTGGVGAGSHIVHIGSTGRGTATLAGDDDGELWFSWNDDQVRRWDYALFLGTPHVVHMVVDTAAVAEASRFRLLVDGAELPPVIVQNVEVGEPAMLPGNAFFALGNRHQDRAIQGVLYYAAIYGTAMSDATIAEHVSLLSSSDDTP